ncbi:MAG: hypothetical protein ACKOUS_05230, partial [Alphaproteobacteria bacterium]
MRGAAHDLAGGPVRMARAADDAREAAARAATQAAEADAHATDATRAASTLGEAHGRACARLDGVADMLAGLEATLGDAAARLRATLVDGKPCPVCGATDHPMHDPGLAALRDRHRAEVEALRTEARDLDARATALREEAASHGATARARREARDVALAAEAKAREAWTDAREAFHALPAGADALPGAPCIEAARAAQDAIVAARGAAREALEAQRMLAQGREARVGIAAALRAWEAVATLAAARRERALLLGGAPTKAHRDAARLRQPRLRAGRVVLRRPDAPRERLARRLALRDEERRARRSEAGARERLVAGQRRRAPPFRRRRGIHARRRARRQGGGLDADRGG